MSIDINELLRFANTFADKSRSILKKNYFKNFKIEEKKDGSLVTEIDKEIELLFRKELKKRFSNHGIVGEEYGNDNQDNEYVWVIDPLDGTHNFIAGKPLFGTLICCLKNNKSIMGIIDIPILDQRWHGGEGWGVRLNSNKCPAYSSKKEYKKIIISSTSLMMFEEENEKKIREIYNKIRFPIFGTDCYAYGLMLSGKIDMIIEENMKPWDYLAQVALIDEQGGTITDWDGKKLGLKSDGKIIASIEKNHHNKTLEYLKN
ncbi:MAG: inositol monophosphatase family protein [Pseudomonadota bacterium]|nr:inositol monophosphatase family protein [Pseudomonadota bacterium]